MKNKKLYPRKRTENRRSQVLAAAEDCFLAHGFHGASMAEISRKAKMSVGHIYNYFESKEAIICALVEREVAGALDLFAAAVKRGDGFVEVMRAYVELQSENVAGSKKEFAVLLHDIMAEVGRNPKITEVMRGYDRKLRDLLGELCRARCPDWSEERTKARIEILMALMISYQFRSVVSPEINKDVYFQELGILLAEFSGSV